MYHLTLKSNLKAIFKNGLIINAPKYCMSDCYKYVRKFYGFKPIFLTEDFIKLANDQLTVDWIESRNPIILKVNTDGLILRPEYYHVTWTDVDYTSNYNWACLQNINVEKLQIVGQLKEYCQNN